MSTRFFPTALTTGMAGTSIDPDLAAWLQARDRHATAGLRAGGHGPIGFSTLLCERPPLAVPQPTTAWRRLRRALKRLSAN